MPEPQSQGPATGTIGRHAPESSPPWQAEAAHAYWAIYFGARKLADAMRTAAGLPARQWGAGDTDRALGIISGLATTVPAEALAYARTTAQGWVTQALRIRHIDEGETWESVPRMPGARLPLCPYCGTLSLRLSRMRQEVRCFFPGCVDYDGKPTRARMEPGHLDERGQLVFGDGTVVAYREEQSTSGGPDEPAPAPASGHAAGG